MVSGGLGEHAHILSGARLAAALTQPEPLAPSEFCGSSSFCGFKPGTRWSREISLALYLCSPGVVSSRQACWCCIGQKKGGRLLEQGTILDSLMTFRAAWRAACHTEQSEAVTYSDAVLWLTWQCTPCCVRAMGFSEGRGQTIASL